MSAAGAAGARAGLLAALALACVAALVLAVSLGPVSVPLADTVTVLLGGEPSDPRWTVVIGTVRLARALTAVAAGAALGVAGLLMQTLFRNPLADPYVLGVSSGAGLGTALYLAATAGGLAGATFGAGAVGFGRLGAVAASGAGAAAVLLLVLAAARRVRAAVTVLVVGVMIGAVASALVSLVLVWTDPRVAQQFVWWGLGSFDATTPADLAMLLPVAAAGLVVAFALAKPLNALLLGESYARSMGVDVGRVRFAVLVAAALLAGVTTAFCGPIAFVGIAVPHLARVLTGTSDHTVLLPATALSGVLTALVCSVVSHPQGSGTVIPLNVVTSLVGGPVVVAVLLRSRRFAAAAA